MAGAGFDCSAKYTAGLFSRASGALICLFDDQFTATWHRNLDKTSQATLDLTDACCDCVPVPWAHEIAFFRDDPAVPVWQGPVTNSVDTGRTLAVTAADKSAYLFRRVTSAPISHAGAPVDCSFMFAELVAQAEAGAPTGLIWVPSFPTGVLTERVVSVNEKIGPVLTALSDDAVDWTAIGLSAYVGGVTVPAGGALVLVTADHWTEDLWPEVESDGATQITRAVIHAQGDIVGIYPPGPAVPDPVFGIIEDEISRPSIASQAEADAAALTYYLRHQGPQIHLTTGRSALSKRFPYALSDLIPGRLFEVLVNSACVEQLLSLRLSQVTVDIEDGHETAVKIDLQPVGTEEAP